MKIIKILTLFYFLIQNGYSQNFVNLNFESANVSGYTEGSIPATNAITGWTAFISGVVQNNILYNLVPLSLAAVTLQGTNNNYGSFLVERV